MSNPTDACIIPPGLPQNPTNYDKYKNLVNRQSYLLCKIKSAELVLQALAFDIARDSVQSGFAVRGMIRALRDTEMDYLEETRKEISRLGELVNEDTAKEEAAEANYWKVYRYTTEQGGKWLYPPIIQTIHVSHLVKDARITVYTDNNVHSVEFTNGERWDEINGIRNHEKK